MFNKHNKFNLDVVNYLIQVGFKFFLNVALHSYYISYSLPPPVISSEQVHFSSSFESLTNDSKVVLNLFLGGEVIGSRLNLSFGLGNHVYIFS